MRNRFGVFGIAFGQLITELESSNQSLNIDHALNRAVLFILHIGICKGGWLHLNLKLV